MSDMKKEIEASMETSIEHFKEVLGRIKTGRPMRSQIDWVIVDLGDYTARLDSLAEITIPDARSFSIAPRDPSHCSPIVKGIEKADLRLGNPRVDGKVVRISIQPLTEDKRKEFVSQCKKNAENAKVSLRKVREDFNKKVKKLKADGEMPEDMANKNIKLIDEQTKAYEKKIEDLRAAKEKEIMTI